jgi:hypothetical protein
MLDDALGIDQTGRRKIVERLADESLGRNCLLRDDQRGHSSGRRTVIDG